MKYRRKPTKRELAGLKHVDPGQKARKAAKETRAERRKRKLVEKDVKRDLPAKDKRRGRHVWSWNRYGEGQSQWPRDLSGIIKPLRERAAKKAQAKAAKAARIKRRKSAK